MDRQQKYTYAYVSSALKLLQQTIGELRQAAIVSGDEAIRQRIVVLEGEAKKLDEYREYLEKSVQE